jgi:hypothetical protein
MSELVFIDTSVWILALRAGGPVAVRQEVEQLLATGRVATTPTNSQAQPLADEELNVASRSHAQRE